MAYLDDPPIDNSADLPCAKGSNNQGLCTGDLAQHCEWRGYAFGYGRCTLNKANIEYTFDRLTKFRKADFVVPIRTLLLAMCRGSDRMLQAALEAIAAYEAKKLSYSDLMAMFYAAAPRILTPRSAPSTDTILAVWLRTSTLKLPLDGDHGKLKIAQELHARAKGYSTVERPTVATQVLDAAVSWMQSLRSGPYAANVGSAMAFPPPALSPMPAAMNHGLMLVPPPGAAPSATYAMNLTTPWDQNDTFQVDVPAMYEIRDNKLTVPDRKMLQIKDNWLGFFQMVTSSTDLLERLYPERAAGFESGALRQELLNKIAKVLAQVVVEVQGLKASTPLTPEIIDANIGMIVHEMQDDYMAMYDENAARVDSLDMPRNVKDGLKRAVGRALLAQMIDVDPRVMIYRLGQLDAESTSKPVLQFMQNEMMRLVGGGHFGIADPTLEEQLWKKIDKKSSETFPLFDTSNSKALLEDLFQEMYVRYEKTPMFELLKKNSADLRDNASLYNFFFNDLRKTSEGAAELAKGQKALEQDAVDDPWKFYIELLNMAETQTEDSATARGALTFLQSDKTRRDLVRQIAFVKTLEKWKQDLDRTRFYGFGYNGPSAIFDFWGIGSPVVNDILKLDATNLFGPQCREIFDKYGLKARPDELEHVCRFSEEDYVAFWELSLRMVKEDKAPDLGVLASIANSNRAMFGSGNWANAAYSVEAGVTNGLTLYLLYKLTETLMQAPETVKTVMKNSDVRYQLYRKLPPLGARLFAWNNNLYYEDGGQYYSAGRQGTGSGFGTRTPLGANMGAMPPEFGATMDLSGIERNFIPGGTVIGGTDARGFASSHDDLLAAVNAAFQGTGF
jgi:hypothetical protein